MEYGEVSDLNNVFSVFSFTWPSLPLCDSPPSSRHAQARRVVCARKKPNEGESARLYQRRRIFTLSFMHMRGQTRSEWTARKSNCITFLIDSAPCGYLSMSSHLVMNYAFERGSGREARGIWESETIESKEAYAKYHFFPPWTLKVCPKLLLTVPKKFWEAVICSYISSSIDFTKT